MDSIIDLLQIILQFFYEMLSQYWYKNVCNNFTKYCLQTEIILVKILKEGFSHILKLIEFKLVPNESNLIFFIFQRW